MEIWLLVQGCDVPRFSASFLDPGPLIVALPASTVPEARRLFGVAVRAEGWGRFVACVQQDKGYTCTAKMLFPSQAQTSVERGTF